MVKIMVRLDLSQYTVEQVLELRALRLLSWGEVTAELRTRGISDVQILKYTRAG